MLRAVLTILLALPMLVPQGMCLRKFDCMGWLLRTPTPATSPVRIERADAGHPPSCRCGCQERAGQEPDEGIRSADDLHVRHAPPPPQEEPCCPAVCKSKLDKIVQVENPEPVGEAVFVGFAPAPATHTCTPPPHRTSVILNAPPRYISFCTFLI